MGITYRKLWKLLIDKKMKKKDLQELAHLTCYTMNKLGRDEGVSTEVIAVICKSLKCDIDDIMEIIPDNED